MEKGSKKKEQEFGKKRLFRVNRVLRRKRRNLERKGYLE